MPSHSNSRSSSALRAFARAREGSVATIFAVSIIPLIIAAGVGVDLSRAVANRSNLQDALDSAALALAHMPASTPQDVLNAKADQWVTANLRVEGMTKPVLTVTPSKGTITIDATADVSTTLTSIVGFTKMPITSRTTVKWGMGHAEVVLVLDNTGSMEGNKLKNLVKASKDLITTLLANNSAADPEAVKIAIVPFSNTVNVGATYKTATWMDPYASAYAGTNTDLFSPNTSTPSVNRFDAFQSLNKAWGGCVEIRPQWVNGVDKSYDISETPPNAGLPGSKIVPMFAPDEPDDALLVHYQNDYLDDYYADTSANWKTRQGNPKKYFPYSYTTGSGRNKTTHNVTPSVQRTSMTSEGYPKGPNYGCGVTALQRLTNSADTLTGVVNKMVAVGNTNVPIGLFWGWMALTPNAPFADGVSYETKDVTKIVIVLTDGANTSSQGNNNGSDDSWYSGVGYAWQNLISTTKNNSFSSQATAINDREKKICQNMKAKNIVIYAVPVEVTDKNAKTFLQGCATTDDPSKPTDKHYIDVTDSDNLSAAFQTLAGSIGNIRISQ